MTWSEASLHRWLAKQPKAARLSGSQGDDAAVLKAHAGRPVLCVDSCVEGVHFESEASAKAVGRKAAGRALSDLAATGAKPQALLLALRAPSDLTEKRLRGFIRGVNEMGEAHGAPLVGGDTTCAPGPCSLSVSAMGSYLRSGRPPGRDRARAGQLVAVTGPLGGSLLGRHLKVRPRIEEAGWLLDLGATALMDVSDGLLLDMERLAQASGVGIDLHNVPIHRDAKRRSRSTGRSALQHALTDGEDYELIACLPRKAGAQLVEQAAKYCPGLEIVGRVRAGHGVGLQALETQAARSVQSDLGTLRDKGWLHGTR